MKEQSPCRDCAKELWPKEECSKTCKRLDEYQKRQMCAVSVLMSPGLGDGYAVKVESTRIGLFSMVV